MKIPTAEEFLEKQAKGYFMLSKKDFTDIMDKYANLKTKYHVKAALKAAYKNAKIKCTGHPEYNKVVIESSIMKAYSIKK